jgi:hypothetical protein
MNRHSRLWQEPLNPLVGDADSMLSPRTKRLFTALDEHCVFLRYRICTTCDGSCNSNCVQCGG